MPKFVVRRGRDAWVIEEAIIEADSAEMAEGVAYWKSEQRKLDWVEVGDVRTYDDTEIMEGETQPYSVETAPVERITLHVTSQERNTILAALRYYQEQGMGEPANRSDAIHDIATDGDQDISMDAEGIDKLCEAINQ